MRLFGDLEVEDVGAGNIADQAEDKPGGDNTNDSKERVGQASASGGSGFFVATGSEILERVGKKDNKEDNTGK